jgi:formylglycine-generating enzyme required for sulfatase activity
VPEAHKDILDSDYSWIPSGSLTVWVPYANEARSVDMHEGFWMGQHLVTQESYTSVMGQNPSHIDDGEGFFRENLPVNNVSWLDAVSFCKAMTNLGKRHDHLPKGYEYRLPSEVEWEYACRGGSATDYYFGDDPTDLVQHAWFKNNSNKQIHPVGLKQPNPWGLYDLYGNIREWVGNSFVNTLLGDSEQDEFRISRGGGYMKSAAECKSSSRSTNSLYHRFRNLGFRVVLAKVS